MTQMTELQAQMMQTLAMNEYTPLNDDDPNQMAETWTSELITNAKEQGVWTSLLNAGLITGMGGGEGYTRMTEAGWAAYWSHNYDYFANKEPDAAMLQDGPPCHPDCTNDAGCPYCGSEYQNHLDAHYEEWDATSKFYNTI